MELLTSGGGCGGEDSKPLQVETVTIHHTVTSRKFGSKLLILLCCCALVMVEKCLKKSC